MFFHNHHLCPQGEGVVVEDVAADASAVDLKSVSCVTIDKNDVLEFLTYRQVLKKVRFCCLKLFRSRHNTNFNKWTTFFVLPWFCKYTTGLKVFKVVFVLI